MNYSSYEVKSVKIGDGGYPKCLSEIKNSPKYLYYRGNIGVISKKSLAIVGSRRMTRYGRGAVDRFVGAAVGEGVVTVSGFMYGVDTEVHRRTVEYGGETIAVFGCGLDVVYPLENEKLYGAILDAGGLVLSEYEPCAKPHLWKFPQRNRIVAGISSMGVLVVEGGEKSGSLITARIAREQGKKVYAVPGPIDGAVSAGTNWLIKKGLAKMATEPADILGRKVTGLAGGPVFGLSGLEARIAEALEGDALNVDEIAEATGRGVVEVGSTLSILVIKGVVSEAGSRFYLVK